MKKIIISILCATVFVLSCSNKNNPKGNTQNEGDQEKISKYDDYVKHFSKDDFYKNISGTWTCYKYEKDRTDDSTYSDDYAKEFTKYAVIDFYNRGRCSIGNLDTINTYVYKYPTKVIRYDNEVKFIFKFNFDSKIDSAIFVGDLNWHDECSPIGETFLYFDENLILLDRNFFFYFKKNNNYKFDYKGIPGNDRTLFFVEKTYKNTNIDNAHMQFKIDYPYTSKLLEKKLSHKDSYIEDNDGGITYKWENSTHLIIDKVVVQGTIRIEFQQINSDVHLVYRMLCFGDDFGDDFQG